MSDRPLTLITGASAGIGRELARRLGHVGHRVIGVARRRDRLDALAAENDTFIPCELDLTDDKARQRFVESLSTTLGLPDYLILNAGMAHYGCLDRVNSAQVQQQIALNFVSVVDMVHQLLPLMLDRGNGRIIVISSVLGIGTVPYSSIYTATKHAINGFVRCLRMEAASRGVSVSAMCPAGVQTEFAGVAMGGDPGKTMRSGAEPLDRVVDGMVRKIDDDRAIIYPTFQAAILGTLMRVAPSFADWVIINQVKPRLVGELPPDRISEKLS